VDCYIILAAALVMRYDRVMLKSGSLPNSKLTCEGQMEGSKVNGATRIKLQGPLRRMPHLA
jgi:hypothetical protein